MPSYTVMQVVPELDTGGVEQTVVDMSAALIAAGARSIVVSKGGRLEEVLKDQGATVIRLPVHSKNPFVQWGNLGKIKRLIRKEKVDIVHVRSRAPAWAALKAACACKVASVTTYHGIYKAKGSLKRRYNGLMTRADVTIANSDYTRDHILATYKIAPEKVVSIPRGVDFARFNPAEVSAARLNDLRKDWGIARNDRRVKFLLAGRLTRWKGQELIIEAARRLKRETSDFLILMAGDDQGRTQYTQSLLSQIEEYGLKDHIRLVGHCRDMPAAYSVCEFALAPSLEPEAFGRTAAEPQAMVRPVLAAAHGATAETVIDGETGWLIAPGDAEAWAQGMQRAIELPGAVRLSMGQKGREHIRAHFTLERMIASTLAVYAKLLPPRA